MSKTSTIIQDAVSSDPRLFQRKLEVVEKAGKIEINGKVSSFSEKQLVSSIALPICDKASKVLDNYTTVGLH
jgi:hypothetical protein